MEEPKKVIRCHFLGVTQVPKATGKQAYCSNFNFTFLVGGLLKVSSLDLVQESTY